MVSVPKVKARGHSADASFRAIAAAAGAAGAVALLGAAQGGYFPTTWGWASLAAVTVAGGALIAGVPRLSGAARTSLGLLACLVLWTGVELLFGHRATVGFPPLERDALYLVALWAALLVVPALPSGAVLAGLLVGSAGLCCDGLGEYLFGSQTSDLVEGRLLYEPLGYANATAMIAATGFVLALGFVASGDRSARTAASGVLVVFVCTLAFTGSRGAALALVGGVAAMLALSPHRAPIARAVSLAVPLGLVPVWMARSGGLAGSFWMRLALALVIVVAVAASAYLAAWRSAVTPKAIAAVLGALAAVAIAVELARHGLSFAASGFRRDYWRVAWRDAARHPLAGSGPGTFARVWLRDRPFLAGARNAHSLYLEALAESGAVGLVLVVAALVAPVVARRRATGPALTAACAYLVFVLHAGVDWDWQMPAVVVMALVCLALALGVVPGSHTAAPARLRVVGVAVCVGAMIVFALSLEGNRSLSQARAAADAGVPSLHARRAAHRAVSLQPWSGEPHLVLAKLELEAGDRVGAVAQFRRAAELDPASWDAWAGIARATGGRTRAVALQRADELDPLDAPLLRASLPVVTP